MTPGIEVEIADGKIGEVGSYDIEFKGLKLVAKAEAQGKAGPVSFKSLNEISLDGVEVLRAIARAIPGEFDNQLLEMCIVALQGQAAAEAPSA